MHRVRFSVLVTVCLCRTYCSRYRLQYIDFTYFLLSEHKSASHNARVRSFRSVRLYAIASFHEPFASSDDSFAGGHIVPDCVVISAVLHFMRNIEHITVFLLPVPGFASFSVH